MIVVKRRSGSHPPETSFRFQTATPLSLEGRDDMGDFPKRVLESNEAAIRLGGLGSVTAIFLDPENPGDDDNERVGIHEQAIFYPAHIEPLRSHITWQDELRDNLNGPIA
jgi:hypothetical protein